MFTMGDDFTYQNARQNFKNMDKLIKYMNSRTEETGIHVMYSTPACYLEVCEYLMKRDKIWIFRQLNRIQLCTQRNQMTSSHMVVGVIVIGQVTLPQGRLSSSRQSDFFGGFLSFEIGLTKLIIFRWNWPNFLTLASGEAWCKRSNCNKTNWHFKEDYWPVMIGSIKKLKSTLKPQWFNLIPALSIIHIVMKIMWNVNLICTVQWVWCSTMMPSLELRSKTWPKITRCVWHAQLTRVNKRISTLWSTGELD